MGLAGAARLGAERIQGDTTDFVGVAFLDLARAARAVGRVVFQSLRAQGSGFLVSDRLFLTNNHVVAGAQEARGFLVEFDHELDVDGRLRVVTRFELDPATYFLTSAEDDLDFTLVALGRRHSGGGEPADFGSCPLF